MYNVVKNRKCTETEIEHLTVKSIPYTLTILTPEAQMFVCFAVRLDVSEIRGRQKSIQGRRKKHGMTPNGT